MAAAKPVTNISQFKNNIQHCISGSVTPRNEIPMATPHIFWVQEFNGSIVDTVQCKRQLEFQDGGRQTGNIYRHSYMKCSQHISASVRRRNKIPTDTNVGWAPGIQRCYSGCCALQT